MLSGKEAIERRYAVVLTMYEMLTEYGGKVPPTDQVSLARHVTGLFLRPSPFTSHT